jgi:hypothetical protein
MFIDKDDRFSRSSPRRRSGGWDAGPARRAPRNWRAVLRASVYVLLALLGGSAALACAALLVSRGSPPSQSLPLSDPVVSAPAPAPAPPPAPIVKPAADDPSLQAVQGQIRDATATLNSLRDEAEKLRQSIADAERARQQAQQVHDTPPPAAAEAPRPLAEAERIAPAQRVAPPPPPPAPAIPAAAATHAPPPTITTSDDNATAVAAAPQPIVRPRVYLHYQSGSNSALQTATNIAQHLLFSDFSYAETRSARLGAGAAVVRYYFPEDAPAASQLAALLSGQGAHSFRVESMTDQPGPAARGRLDVWIGAS